MAERWETVTEEWFTAEHPSALHPVGLRIDPVGRRVWLERWDPHCGVGAAVLVDDAGQAVAVRPHHSAA